MCLALIDYQAGLESGLTALVGALAGIDMISGAGMLDSLRCHSAEKLVLDAEGIAMAQRRLRGVATPSETLATAAIRGAGWEARFLELPETRKLLEACMREVRAVAIAHGINLPEAVIPGMMEYLDSLAPSSTTSLQRDIADGKRSELDYWNGAVVRLAADKNVAVPTHRIIYDLLLPLHRQAMGELTFPN